MRLGSVQLPGIDDLQSVNGFKVFGVARDKLQVGGQSDGCNLSIFGADGKELRNLEIRKESTLIVEVTK